MSQQTLPAPRQPAPPPDGLDAPSPAAHARGPILFGLAVVLVCLVGSAVWAGLVPLASAAIAPGTVIVDSHRKTIQHLEGGIVKSIAVEDGQVVFAGTPLVVLDDTQARAELDVVRSQYIALKAREARLIAERDGLDTVTFDHPIFRETAIAGHAQAVAGQQSAFTARHRAITSQIEINGQRAAQLKEQIIGLEAQVAAADRQLALIQEEHKDVKTLFLQGNERKPRLLELERTMAEISGNRGSYLARIAEARQKMIEAELEAVDIRTKFMTEVVKELGEVQSQVADMEERFRALNDRVDRAVVRAPTDGTVVNLRIHTLGGVIAAGGEVLDLVPINDSLVIEAMVRPEDVEAVHAGLKAQVRVTSFEQRSVPALDGTVARVSADRLEDKRTGNPYYRARIHIDPASLARLDGLELQPGMPAEVMIKTGERPLLEALLSPILHSLNRALREG